jgi:hypothetical protein
MTFVRIVPFMPPVSNLPTEARFLLYTAEP